MAPPAFLPIMPAKHVLEARIEAPGAADTPMTALPIEGREPSTAQSAAMADIATTVRGPKTIDRIEFAKPSRFVTVFVDQCRRQLRSVTVFVDPRSGGGLGTNSRQTAGRGSYVAYHVF